MSFNVWRPFVVDVGQTDVRRVGGVAVWVKREPEEWRVCHVYEDGTTGDEPEETRWTRYVTGAGETLALQPALPDRPVVIRPRAPVVLLPGQSGRFFFSVPLWLRFVSSSGTLRRTVDEVPSRSLSSTWFGDMDTGELCYAVDSRLLRSTADEDDDDAFARCEVEIRNSSREKLKFERISVHVEFMHLYAADDRFWSNAVRVVFKGAEQISQLSYRAGPPNSLPNAESICEPREAQDLSLFKRSFNLIREIAGI